MITADHGCDPGYTVSTDHSREYTPFIMYGSNIEPKNLGTRKTFADIGATVLQYFGIVSEITGTGMLDQETDTNKNHNERLGGNTRGQLCERNKQTKNLCDYISPRCG